MAVQFAGAGSTGDRRRRRIVVNGDGAEIDPSLVETESADFESQLVASAAAGPWVPASELRIWIYASLIAGAIGALIYAVLQPLTYRAEIRPITDLLFNRTHPLILVVMEVVFLGLSALLGHLIGWYRSRGKLDFAGRYRFWPWASALFGMSAFCLATDTHRALGQVIENLNWDQLTWRASTVGWLLPVAVMALPIVLFLDRDIRHCRSCLWTIRLSVSLWITEAMFEIYKPELRVQPWFELSYSLIPVFASMTLFLGLWLHARIVAYVCPDPPELDQPSAWSQLLAAGAWTLGLVAFWRWAKAEQVEEEATPKRRRKKAESEEGTTKRKRKTPAKRSTSRSRTRTKPVEEDEAVEEAEEEQVEEETPSGDEAETLNESVDESSSNSAETESEEQQTEERWEEDAEEEDSHDKGRYNQVHRSHGSSAPAPHSRRRDSSWEEESGYEEASQSNGRESSEDADDDEQGGYGSSRIDPEQLKGLSKRQKRELKKQLRDQERARGR